MKYFYVRFLLKGATSVLAVANRLQEAKKDYSVKRR